MLYAEITKNYGAIKVWGTSFDLGELHDLVHEAAKEGGVYDVETGNWLLGFAYEVRKAREEHRDIMEVRDFHDKKIPLYGFEIALPYWLIYIGVVRYGLSYDTISADQQSLLWKLQGLTLQALGDIIPTKKLEALITFSQGFSGQELAAIITPTHRATAYFLRQTKAKRLKILPELMRALHPAFWTMDSVKPPELVTFWPTNEEEIEAIWLKHKF